MPGYATHLLVQQRIAEGGRSARGPFGDCARKMLAHPQEAAMGSLGPDLTFFLDLYPLAQIWLLRGVHAYEALNDFLAPYAKAIADVQTAVDQAAAATVPGYTAARDAFQQFGAAFDLISGTFQTAMEAFATGYIDGFAFIKLAMQRAEREEKWCWFDMLHYRRTGRFAQTLFEKANGDPVCEAFAAGYVSHLATDVTGHAFVNACAGGPFRTQWQRHHCADNYIDVWTMQHYFGGDINVSQWDKRYPQTMPPAIRRQFLAAMQETYGPIRRPDGSLLEGRAWPSGEDIDRMWEVYLRAIQMQTNLTVLEPPKPPDTPIDFETFPTPPPYSETAAGGRRREGFSLEALLEALITFIADTVKYVKEVVTWVTNTTVTTTLWPFQYALFVVQASCYDIYRACRRVLALRGYVFAHPDELAGGARISQGAAGTLAGAVLVGADHLGYDFERNFYTVGHRGEPRYPHEEGVAASPKLLQDAQRAAANADGATRALINLCIAAGGFPQAFQQPWLYPTTSVEPEPALNCPYEEGSLPDIFIEKAGFSREIYDGAKRIADAETMRTWSLQAGQTSRSCLGNASDLGRAMLEDTLSHQPIPDFNLDGDRGYGWLCWDVEPIGSTKRLTRGFNLGNVVVGPRVGSPK